METALGWVTEYGAISLFFLMALGIIGLPIPDETLLVFSGYLIYRGTLNPVFTFTMAFLGAITGITVSYALGRKYGHTLIHKYGRYFHFTEERFLKVHNWFERIGRWSLFFGYYIAGVRHFTAMVAGASELEYPRFAMFAYSGAFTWVAGFLSLGYFIGERWQAVSEQVHGFLLEVCIVIGVMLGIYLLVRWVRKRS
jgi:membrane protein DedA with SNARE-associated domain